MDLENQIGLCSEIISKASRLEDAKLRNAIFRHVGDHRQNLRELADKEIKMKKNE